MVQMRSSLEQCVEFDNGLLSVVADDDRYKYGHFVIKKRAVDYSNYSLRMMCDDCAHLKP